MASLPARVGEYLFRRRFLVLLVLAVNFLSALYGFYWYRYQLSVTPWYLWLFTPDCPLAALLMAVALGVFLIWGQRRTWFHFLTATILIKYGFWTVFVFAAYWLAGGQNYSFGYLMLCISHAGMLIEGAVLLAVVPRSAALWCLAGVWSLVFDFFDYFFRIRIAGRISHGVYPFLPNEAHRPLILVMTLCVTAAFFLGVVVEGRRKRMD